MKNYVVYMHKNKINNKVYIGMTKDIATRWKSNGIQYKPKNGKENSRPFWNAIKKYGFESFEHIILEENLSKEEACEKEKYVVEGAGHAVSAMVAGDAYGERVEKFVNKYIN